MELAGLGAAVVRFRAVPGIQELHVHRQVCRGVGRDYEGRGLSLGTGLGALGRKVSNCLEGPWGRVDTGHAHARQHLRLMGPAVDQVLRGQELIREGECHLDTARASLVQCADLEGDRGAGQARIDGSGQGRIALRPAVEGDVVVPRGMQQGLT